MKHYWVGTMNRVTQTEGENSLPVKAEHWEQEKDNWHEVTAEQYEKAYAAAWNSACESFWHC